MNSPRDERSSTGSERPRGYCVWCNSSGHAATAECYEAYKADRDRPRTNEELARHLERARDRLTTDDIQRIAAALRGPAQPTREPGLGDIVSVMEGVPYFHDWRGVQMKIISLCVAPDGRRFASVIDNNDPSNTRHRGFGIYDGETTGFPLDQLEKASALPSTSRGTEPSAPAPESSR
jgi:hypothetical protein